MSMTQAQNAGQPSRERRLTRREAVKGLAGGTAGVVGLAATSGLASASEEHADAKPNHVTISFDEAWLDRYRPHLDLRAVPHDNHPNLYGWKVTSTESDFDTHVGVYACEYAVQKGVLALTSHAGDHEWIYVYVDPSTGEVRQVSYAFYHWLRGYVTDPAVTGSGNEHHPMFTVAPTYHHYAPVSTLTDSSVLLDPNSLGDYSTRTGPLYRWLDNGMAGDLEPGAVHNPWLLDSDGPLDSWWAREGSGRTNRWLVGAWAFIGFGFGFDFRGSGPADPGEADL